MDKRKQEYILALLQDEECEYLFQHHNRNVFKFEDKISLMVQKYFKYIMMRGIKE